MGSSTFDVTLVLGCSTQADSSKSQHIDFGSGCALIAILICNVAVLLCRAANILLLIAKVVAFVVSLSFAVLASAADSLVDLASQVRRQWQAHMHSCCCTSQLATLTAGATGDQPLAGVPMCKGTA